MKKFKDFYVTEMPHGKYHGIPTDLKLEKSDWNSRLVFMLNGVGDKMEFLKPFYNLNYKKALQNKFKALAIEDQTKLINVLPEQFIKDMELS